MAISVMIIASFSGTDGSGPDGPLLLDFKGDLFGMTLGGGDAANPLAPFAAAEGTLLPSAANSFASGVTIKARILEIAVGASAAPGAA